MLNQAGVDLRVLAAAQIEAEFACSVREWLEGATDELPEPSLFGLSDEEGAKLAAETARVLFSQDEASLTASWYDEAALAYEQISKAG
jgi:hypothetical protein